MFRLLLASILVLTSSIANAQVEAEDCHGQPGPGVDSDGYPLPADTIWQGDFLKLEWNKEPPNWDDYTINRSLGYGDLGTCASQYYEVDKCGDATTDYQICHSLSPFTTTNTNNGETCINEGPLEWKLDTTYYRMQINRATTPTTYCQIKLVTDASACVDCVGRTEVVTLDDSGNNGGIVPDPDGPGDDKYPGQGGGGQGRNQATPVPTMSMYLLMGLSGLLALFGFYRVRASK